MGTLLLIPRRSWCVSCLMRQGTPVIRQQLFTVQAQVLSSWVGGIRSVAHHSLPQNAIELRAINAISIGEVHPSGNSRPVLCVWRRIIAGDGGAGQGQAGAVENRRRGCGKTSICLERG